MDRLYDTSWKVLISFYLIQIYKQFIQIFIYEYLRLISEFSINLFNFDIYLISIFKVLHFLSSEILFLLLVSTRQFGGLFLSFYFFRSRIFHSFSRSSSFLSAGRIKWKAPFALSATNVNEALLAVALIACRFFLFFLTFGRYFINSRGSTSEAARESLVLSYDLKASHTFNSMLFLITSRAIKSECYYRSLVTEALHDRLHTILEL